MFDLSTDYASQVFTPKAMKERLPADVYTSLKKSIDSRTGVDPQYADTIACAMKDWAIEQGATHFTHWFQPMTGVTAEKHDSFVDFEGDRELVLEFSGKELVRGEPDASSFPSGGIRATYEARGYTTWDPTSYAFVKDTILYIPTAFVSYSGEALDKKTPLLRSMQALSKQGQRILKLFGSANGVDVVANIGAEQEYFLIDESMYEQRPDLVYAGRTLYGAAPPKGQDLDDHYFGVIKPRVLEFMEELDETLWSLGIASKTRHNEVAPAQHEVAAVYESANAATDHNQLIMETIKTVAPRHGLVALTNEKPFAGVNGSGKHLNWSLSTSTGENLLDPGKTPSDNARFLLFLSAVIKAVDEHQDLLRMSVATAANDHRLGKAEAPPAIISIFLGEELTEILDGIKAGEKVEAKKRTKFDLGVDVLPNFTKDTTDRNRTSPFAFTGNKFEFRMVGSSLSTAGPGFILNAIVADALTGFADRLEKAGDFKAELAALIKETIVAHERIIFNGNNYSDEWVEEAEKRGLLNLLTTVDALPYFITDENIALLDRQGVLSETETRSRYELLLEAYVKILRIEAASMLEIAHRDIVPAVISYSADVANAAAAKVKIGENLGVAELAVGKKGLALEKSLLAKLCALSDDLDADISALESAMAGADEDADILDQAAYCKSNIIAAMEKLRATADTLEMLVDSGYWPLPSYGEILYSVK
ncbi:MAG: glutamine synthetase III [Clostridiales Family XIII bacterium]|jgi:glutamine synthetase|nr:glutamine synthetase III [Clostridiales Family XIII bacterium]